MQFFGVGANVNVLSRSLISNPDSINMLECSLEIVADIECIKLKYPMPDSFFRAEEGWPESNEPDEHLKTISNEIRSLGDLEQVFGFSYKDTGLMSLIGHECSADPSRFLITGQDSMSLSSPESIVCFDSEVPAPREKCKLLIMRHYLEHSQDPAMLLRLLRDFLSPDGYIYIEVPSIEYFLSERVPLFLWEQHRSYFTLQAIQRLCQRIIGPCIYNKSHGSDIEPSHCIIAKYVPALTPGSIDTTALELLQDAVFSINHFAPNYFNIWSRYLRSLTGEKCLFGIGHVAERFLQLTDSINLFQSYADSSSEKIGRRIYGSNKFILNSFGLDLGKIDSIILGVHHRDTKRVTLKLRSRGYTGTILSIYGYPE